MTSRDDRSGPGALDQPGSGVGPVVALHTHVNPITGAVVTGTWPCAQCKALGRTEPLRYVSDGGTVPDNGRMGATPIPDDRLEAFLASFPAPGTDDASPVGGRRPGRKARRKAERQARRRNR